MSLSDGNSVAIEPEIVNRLHLGRPGFDQRSSRIRALRNERFAKGNLDISNCRVGSTSTLEKLIWRSEALEFVVCEQRPACCGRLATVERKLQGGGSWGATCEDDEGRTVCPVGALRLRCLGHRRDRDTSHGERDAACRRVCNALCDQPLRPSRGWPVSQLRHWSLGACRHRC